MADQDAMTGVEMSIFGGGRPKIGEDIGTGGRR
jgi:hypothetical protein